MEIFWADTDPKHMWLATSRTDSVRDKKGHGAPELLDPGASHSKIGLSRVI